MKKGETVFRKKAILAVCGLILLFSPAVAQTVSSSLVGTLADSSGAVVPNASIALSNQATGAGLKVQSNSGGLFRFPNLLAGTYTLSIQHSGFKTYVQQDIVVSSSETRDLGRVVLEIGNLSEQITVTAEVTPLQTASSEKSALVSGDQLSTIALKGRDFFGLMSTLPGVVDTRNRDNTSNAGTLSGMNINGLPNNKINYTIDGVSANDTGSNSDIHVNGNIDSIAEVRVLTSNYQAEFGRKAGATISVVTKGGGRDYHGSAYWSHRHEQFNANGFFSNRAGRNADGSPVLPRVPYRFNVPGYTFSGPVPAGRYNQSKDKLFFFFGQEFTRQRRNFDTQYRTMPTELERAGDFSQSLDTGGKMIIVKDPTTGTQFSGNKIPASRINATGQSILKFLPLPNFDDPNSATRLQRNYAMAASGQYPRRSETIRIDANPASRLHLYYRLLQEPESQDAPWGQWFTGSNFLLQYARLWRPGRHQVVSATYTINPTLVNEMTYGQSYSHIYYNILNPEKLQRSAMNNIPQWFTGANGVSVPEKSRSGYPPGWLHEDLIPNVSFGSTPVSSPTIGLSNTPYENWNQIYSFTDNVTKIWGNHTIKAGAYIEHTGKFATNQSGTSNLYRGTFDFGQNTNNPYNTGHGFGNTLLGEFNSYTESNSRTAGHFWYWNVESFVQDNWRVTRRLTLDIGVRFAYLTSLKDTNTSLAGFDPTSYSYTNKPRMYFPAMVGGKRMGVDPADATRTVPAALINFFVPNTGSPANGMRVGGKDGYPTGMSTYKTPSISPRFGFAWDLFGNGKTAIRGGAGFFSDRPNTNETGEALQGNPPLTYTPTLYYGNLATFTSAAGYLSPSNVTFMWGDYKVPTTINYSFGIQQSVGFSTVVEASYVGNVMRHNWWNRPTNSIAMGARFDPKNFDPTLTGNRPLSDNFFRPYLGWGNLTLLEFNNNSNYNSLQVAVRRQFSRRMLFGLSYTLSKVLGYENPSFYFKPRDRNYGLQSMDRTNILTFNYSYELPGFGARLGSKWLGAITDEWIVAGFTTFTSGAPFTPSFSRSDGAEITGSSEGARITVVGDPYLPKSERTFARNFNTDAFATTPVRSFGNAGIGILRGPGINSWDIFIAKRIPIGLGEGRSLMFRAEGFNAFNHTQFAGISSSARFDATGKQTTGDFGAYSSARDPRRIAFSLRLAF